MAVKGADGAILVAFSAETTGEAPRLFAPSKLPVHETVFAMTIHPDVSGRPQVQLMLERVFDYINGHTGVAFCTFNDIADDFRLRHPRSGTTDRQAAE